MRRTDAAPVVVVGAGAAGLAVAAALGREGTRAVVLEAEDRVGAVWARRYDRLRLHTVRRFSALPYRPLPDALPRYVSKDDYARYLADYARELALDVRLRHRAERIVQSEGEWLVATNGGDFRSRAVVVATGKHGRKHVPAWPGREDFTGRVIHSADYRSGAAFAGRRALVVGLGNSGAELAVDLVEHGAASVAVAVRNAPPIVRRELAGVPVQLLGLLLAPLPARPVDQAGAALRRVAIGNLRPYGLAEPAWGPFEARRPPVIDVGFLDALTSGRVDVRPEVQRFTRTGVVFADGREEDFDVVVTATGFTSTLPELLDLPGVLDEQGQPRTGRDGASSFSGLYFVGFRESPRGALYEASRDARRVARALTRSRRRTARGARAPGARAPAPGGR
jgi:putative flavoprotein involved in K+ transport